ncbi:MmcB family DNA repair protein [Pedomonas sp. V897]|uniref:MmcB family DNA repair protein n=1 Tax=Pedomonas sp. V897 TaxID=3446482 RepID=UPI003EDE8330
MPDAPSPAARLLDARDVARGVSRLLYRMGCAALTEFPLGNGRRADVAGLSRKGQITLVEIKVSLADLRGDAKWPEYLDYCDDFYFAVPAGFPLDDFHTPAFLPERAGLIVADRFEAAILRPAACTPLSAARRKAETLRFARHAAHRLFFQMNPGFEG